MMLALDDTKVEQLLNASMESEDLDYKENFDKIVELAGRLICTDAEFEDFKETLRIKEGVRNKDEQIEIHAKLDILVSRLYGIEPGELEHILRQFEPKNTGAQEELEKHKNLILKKIKLRQRVRVVGMGDEIVEGM